MSLFKTYTDEEITALKKYGLWTGTHSQACDFFVCGYRESKANNSIQCTKSDDFPENKNVDS